MRLAWFFGVLLILPAGAQERVNHSPRFEVASVRPSAPGTQGVLYHMPGDRLKLQGMTLEFLVSYAWDVPPDQIIGLPKWAGSDRFDIDAIPENRPHSRPKELESPRKKAMVRNLLEDRFKLQAHVEQRDAPTYLLVIAKNGPKLTRNSGGEYHIQRRRASVFFQKVSMAQFAKFLSENLRGAIGRPVIDRTAIEGEFDFTIAWASMNTPDADLPSIFGAIEQLGLKLQPDHGPVPFLVVEHANPPTPN